MSDAAKKEFQEKFRLMREAYGRDLPQRMHELHEAWNQLKGGKRAAVAEMASLAHKLAGSGATFGYAKLTDVAREVETVARAIMDGKSAAGLMPKLESLFAGIDARILQPDNVDNQVAAAVTPSKKISRAKPVSRAEQRKLVYVVDDDVEFGKALALQIHYFGYDVQGFPKLQGLMEAIKKTPPSAIIMDIQFPEGDLAGARSIAGIQKGRGVPIPVVFLSTRGDVEARLEAVRAGASAYFTKPVEIGQLIDKLDALTSIHAIEPYRVLVVDDSPIMAQLYGQMLLEAGMEVSQVTDPMLVMQQLDHFNPELILMDMYMPGCNGPELAAIIRQQSNFDSLPIVFLSAETDVAKQLAAMREGGDDFLTKPIQADHLVSSVSIRANRYRALRSMMVKDSLTGLFNHTKILDSLNIEIARAMRQKKPLSFAMVDLDHFKSVNDTYGHPVGDRVIQSLSRLLRERLRKTDLIGRYGGEEFAVIMPDTEGKMAVRILDEARLAFKNIKQFSEDKEFHITFSAGVASYHTDSTAEEINKAADDALYQSKRAGRNMVSLGE